MITQDEPDLVIEQLRTEVAALERQRDDAIADAKGWMTKYSIEKEMNDAAGRQVELIETENRRLTTELEASFVKLQAAKAKVEAMLDVILLLARRSD